MAKIFVDTNIFVYTLFKIDKQKQERCILLFSKAEEGKIRLWTTEWVIAELIWFLQRQKAELDKVKKIILKILATKGLEVEKRGEILEAMDIWNETVNFVDSINIIYAKNKEILSLFSFDKGFDQIKTVKRIEP